MASIPHPFDYAQALESHLNWVSDLQFKVTCGIRLDPLQVRDTNGSALGCWLHGEGAVYADRPEAHQLEDALQDLHLVGSVVAAIANLKTNEEALRIFQNSPVFLSAAGTMRQAMAHFFQARDAQQVPALRLA